MTEQTAKNLIIGAGPAGLAVAARLRKAQQPFVMLEATDKIAYSWHHHYERLCLHTVKELSGLPHRPFPEDYPRYVPRAKMVEYMQYYATEFDIQPRFGEKVRSVKREGESWQVVSASDRQYRAEKVIVATGVNRIPNIPEWPGQESFAGEILHSRMYRNPAPFRGKQVMVVGPGNSGAEIALDLAEAGEIPWLSIRGPLVIVPRDVFGRPVQVTAKHLARLPFGIGDWLGTQTRRLVIGDMTAYGVPVSSVHPAVLLRETGKTPLIDLGTCGMIKKGRILAVPAIARFQNDGVLLTDSRHIPLDTVILATGYKAMLAEFIKDIAGLLDEYDIPKGPIAGSTHPGLYFVGYDGYKLGGILGTIYTDSATVVQDICRRMK